MLDQLEIVVAGQRQLAMPAAPHLTSSSSPWSGFLLEQHPIVPCEMPDHWIPYYLLTIVLSEEPLTRYWFEGGREHQCRLADGHCTVVSPHELRRFRVDKPGGMIALAIEPETLENMLPDSLAGRNHDLLRRWSGDDPILKSLILGLHADLEAGCPAGPLRGESLCTRLAVELIQRYPVGRVQLDRYKGGLSKPQLRRVLDYIESLLHLNLTVGDIAQIAGLSKYHFGKAFKQSTGMTLHSYVLGRRMKRAQQLLLRENLSLADIGEAAGFSSQSHFTTVFSTRIGLPPGLYRERNRKVQG